MYHQAWPWGAAATPTATSGFVQPTASTQVATTQWPAGYSQYTVTPEIQQQWAAAWASQAQYAYGSSVPVGADPQTTAAAFTGAYPDYQSGASTAVTPSEAKKPDDTTTTSEKSKTTAEQPPSKELSESEKIQQLKEQAEKWTSLQQSSASWSASTASSTTPSSGITTTVTAPNDSSKSLTSTNVTQSSDAAQSQLSKEEEEFERQFKDWEVQFEAWKQQNQNHPDKEAFAQYEKQWQEWRAQLLQKKEQMQKAKAEQIASNASLQSSSSTTIAGAVNTQTTSTNITDTTVPTSTAAMYYQHPSYMYMQPYMYPGATTVAPAAAMPPTALPPAVVPQAVMPPPMVPPTGLPSGVPPVTMPPIMPPAVPQQMQYNAPPGPPDNYGNQGRLGMPGHQQNDNMNYDNQGQDYENERDMYNYGPPRGNGSRDDNMGPNFDGFDNPNMPEGNFQRDNWKFGRGRGRGGRGRARGRGQDRWSEPTGPDMDVRPGAVRPQRKTLLPGGPGTFLEDDGPPPFEYPTEDCRDEFAKEHGPFSDRQHPGNRFNFHDGPQQFSEDVFPSEPFDDCYPLDPNKFPPDQEFPDRFPPNQGYPRDRKRFPPDHDRFPPDQERFPPGRDRFPPGREGFPLNQERFPPGRDGFPPDQERFPPGHDGFLPDEERFPPGRDGFPPGRDRFSRNDRFNPANERFSRDQEGFPPDQEHFPPDQERFPPKGGRFPSDNEMFPPEDERFPPGHERFVPPRHMMDEGGFGARDFNEFPPEDEMFGPPPFRDDFPPFEERGGRGRGGRFSSRGRFQGEFDRYGPPFSPRMRNDFPPDFPPEADDRFGFPGDEPGRMPPPRGMRPPFESGFGSEGRFRDEPPFFEDGPQRFKSIDYTHRPASAVMGDDFNPHYEFESEFQDDVNDFRDNFNSGVYLAHHEPIIFSQVSVESFDYGHGMKPMTSTTIEGKESLKDNEPASTDKGFERPFHRDRSPAYRDRNFNQDRNANFNEREAFRDRDREAYKSKDRDRNRERSRENDRDRDREKDRDRKDGSRDRERDRDNYDRGRAKDRDSKRDRDWDSDYKRDGEEKRFKWDKSYENDRDKNRGSSKKESDSKTVDVSLPYKPPVDIFKSDSSETVLIEDILVEPKRSSRPKQLVIILRGLPGSGKTYFAKLIKEKEIENGGSAPRILSLDDYFMVETEVTETDPDTGKRVIRKEFKFEFEHEMEETYRSSLFKSFKKTIDDRYFPFIIVDAVNGKSKQYEEYWSYAKQKGFQVYIAEMDCKDPIICHKRNIHNRTLEDINKILQQWEPKPKHFISMDVRSLLQDVSITEVEMEVESSDKSILKSEEIPPDEDSEESNMFLGHAPSRWEKLEATEEKLDQLDGLRVNKKKHSSMEDYLQLPDDYDERKCEPGKKRVRWADLEQRKEQDRLRAIGFVVGQTDWTKLTDPTQADKALTKTKYF